MDRFRKPIQWFNRLKTKSNNYFYDISTYNDELMLDSSILSRPPMADVGIEPLAPATFPEMLAEATAQPKATADILRKTLDGKIQLDDHPMYWDRGFFDQKAAHYFAPVFSHVCLFAHEEREALMAECTPLFEQLEASIREVADSIARGEVTVDDLTPTRSSNAAYARVYLDKLTDLYMTRVDVVRGRYDDQMRLWREEQGRLFDVELSRETSEILGTFDRRARGYVNFSYPRYKADTRKDESSKFTGQWLPVVDYLPRAHHLLPYLPYLGS
ncbi:unnamed protein product [Clonostachys byssicola]|uniref:Uncharacterized protein n=1 Tax=Clonostachys byssicola TaxID=160290 RepID=A0A9N9XVR5_9HYPO|nr:unnamed protein product [Clonostachys byssicola]